MSSSQAQRCVAGGGGHRRRPRPSSPADASNDDNGSSNGNDAAAAARAKKGDQSATTTRKIQSVVCPADYAELRRHYRFVPDEAAAAADDDDNGAGEEKDDAEAKKRKEETVVAAARTAKATAKTTTWQERMVARYDEHLYREYALADMRYARQGKLGLRWRTKREVIAGKGSSTCGNKHCPSLIGTDDDIDDNHDRNPIDVANAVREYQREPVPDTDREQRERLERVLPHGALQSDWEVPFEYVEQGRRKTELIKLRLCARCAPLLFLSKGEPRPFLEAARRQSSSAQQQQQLLQGQGDPPGSSDGLPDVRVGKEKTRRRRRDDDDSSSTSRSDDDASSSSSDSDEKREKKRKSQKNKKKRRHKKKKRGR